jgi:hypothetical protein
VETIEILEAVAKLDFWLETMRGPDGYGGPVVHWWQNCLQFTGAGLDWRYEGIILGYLNLYRKTGNRNWLRKARRAGDDLVQGQLSTGNFRNSSFEQNPYPGGTPHEAACDLALLHMVDVLKELDEPAREAYLTAAKWNIQRYYIAKLWDPRAQFFRDSLDVSTFVPNKSATLVEALLMLARLTHDDSLVEMYVIPTLEAILAHQVQVADSSERVCGDMGPLQGGIYQYSQDGRMVRKFFPYYISRCIPALVQGYAKIADQRYLDAAYEAMRFLTRWRYADGSFPQVIYPDGYVNRYPQWVAGVGDILRAMALLRPYGLDAYPELTESWLLRGQELTGGFRTAWGFASQISQREPGVLPEFRDLLPVVGWNDKVFRYLTELTPTTAGTPATAGASTVDTVNGLLISSIASLDDEVQRISRGSSSFQAPCVYRDLLMRYRETPEVLELYHKGQLTYRWKKGAPWAEVYISEMLLK